MLITTSATPLINLKKFLVFNFLNVVSENKAVSYWMLIGRDGSKTHTHTLSFHVSWSLLFTFINVVSLKINIVLKFVLQDYK